MKRFIDMRHNRTNYLFAWWDTIFDAFETHSVNMARDSWEEFAEDFQGDELDRYKALCPPWVFSREDFNVIMCMKFDDGIRHHPDCDGSCQPNLTD